MSKLAHSNQATMDEIERQADDGPDEGSQLGRIVTSFARPPIPLRQFDWCALYEGNEEGPCGYGRTEQEAIDDLVNNYDAPEPIPLVRESVS